MPASRKIHIGPEFFTLAADLADAVEVLRHHDPAAALALARRHRPLADGHAVHVSMMMMDAAPSAALPSPSAQPERKTPMSTRPMVKIRIGESDHYVDAAVARELGQLRGSATAYKAIAQDALQPAATVPATDAQSLAIAARDAIRAEQACARDPSTARGRYIEYLTNAHKTGR